MTDLSGIIDSKKLNEEIEKLKRAATSDENWDNVEESEVGSNLEISSDFQG